MKEVEQFYDLNCLEEWERLDRHKVEYDITKKYLGMHLQPGCSVLDAGGGPGKYAIYLAKQGHTVTLMDLSSANIRFAGEKAREAGVRLEGLVHGNVLDLSSLIPGQFDAVLCMGPLYHLPQEEDRNLAVSECLRKLKPGGTFVASFISAYAPIVDCIKKYPEDIVGNREKLLGYLQDGRNIVSRENPGFTTAYFIHPMDIGPWMASFGLKQTALAGVEGLTAQSEAKINDLPQQAYEEWLDLLFYTSVHPCTFACCEHFLYAGRKAEGKDIPEARPKERNRKNT
ncbi:MAG: methyltransferase domain-containing protein [Clostridia bacterium]